MSKSDDSSTLVFKIIGVIIWLLIAPFACTSKQSKVETILEQEGITEVEVKGFQYFTCGSDSFNRGFTGVKNGRRIEGAVCEGWLKGYTVRYE